MGCLEESYSPIMTSLRPNFYHILQAPAQLEKAVQGASALQDSLMPGTFLLPSLKLIPQHLGS